MATISHVPDQNEDVEEAMQEYSHLPLPMVAPMMLTDPNLLSEEGACERNYKARCPVGFVVVGSIFGDGERCGPDRTIYSGPCKDRTIKFHKLTNQAKQRWATLCNFQWPCKNCKKDFSQTCPTGWSVPEKEPEGSRVCKASDTYQGPCDSTKNFEGYNDMTKELWSQVCQAYWPCSRT